MTSIQDIRPKDLAFFASAYTYDADELHEFEKHLWHKMASYGDGYGHAMIEHLSRTSINLHDMLLRKGYSQQVAINIAHANFFHDLGKVMQAPSLYNLPDKPSAEVKAERSKHTHLITAALENALEHFPHLRGHPHTAMVNCLGRNHHERINGIGPQGLSGDEVGEIMEIVGIIDAVDGKSLPRVNDVTLPADEAGKRQMTRTAQALRDMTGLPAYTDTPQKHAGEFRTSLLMETIECFQEKTKNIWILPHPRGQKPVLAFV